MICVATVTDHTHLSGSPGLSGWSSPLTAAIPPLTAACIKSEWTLKNALSLNTLCWMFSAGSSLRVWNSSFQSRNYGNGYRDDTVVVTVTGLTWPTSSSSAGSFRPISGRGREEEEEGYDALFTSLWAHSRPI